MTANQPFLLTRLSRGVTFLLRYLHNADKFLLTRLSRGVTGDEKAALSSQGHFYSHASREA